MNKLTEYNLNLKFDDYLALEALSYSTLKSIRDLKNGFNQKDEVDELTTIFKARDLGSIIDDLLLGNEDIDKNYIISSTETPTASALTLANYIIRSEERRVGKEGRSRWWPEY